MSAIKRQPNKKSSKNSTLMIGGVILVVAGLLFVYLMVYTAPQENLETVKVVAITDNGCIAETLDEEF